MQPDLGSGDNAFVNDALNRILEERSLGGVITNRQTATVVAPFFLSVESGDGDELGVPPGAAAKRDSSEVVRT